MRKLLFGVLLASSICEGLAQDDTSITNVIDLGVLSPDRMVVQEDVVGLGQTNWYRFTIEGLNLFVRAEIPGPIPGGLLFGLYEDPENDGTATLLKRAFADVLGGVVKSGIEAGTYY